MLSDQSNQAQAKSRPAQAAPVPAAAFNRSWESCASLRECQVPLVGLEISISFDGLGEPIRYDAEQGMLRYRGTMSHASFLQLQKVSRERHYQRALEQLFVASAMPVPAPALAKPWVIWTGTGAAAAVMACGLWYSLSGRAPAKPTTEGNNVATSAESMNSAATVTSATVEKSANGSTSPEAISQAQAR